MTFFALSIALQGWGWDMPLPTTFLQFEQTLRGKLALTFGMSVGLPSVWCTCFDLLLNWVVCLKSLIAFAWVYICSTCCLMDSKHDTINVYH